MWARSSRPSLLGCLAVVIACGKSTPAKPEANPDDVKAFASKAAHQIPTPAAVRDCTPADFTGGAPITFRALLSLAGEKLTDAPEEAAWINPPELDAPAVRTLLDTGAAPTAKREAAAALLAAPFYVVYKVDLVNAPMALGVKELKIGTVGTRIVRFEKSGAPSCVLVWMFQNDQTVSDAAIDKSDKPAIDPGIAKILREDLTAQFIKLAPRTTPAHP
jgi:hypothetical protein